MSSLQDNITQEVNSSNDDVKDRAKAEFADEEKRSIRLNNDIKEQDKEERKFYANLIFTTTTLWLTLVLIVFVAIGQGRLHYSDSVIITLLTTTTANVIGLSIIVANYLFRNK
jgi:hypothetical protein